MKMIEHRGIVKRVENGKAIVAMETAGCASCAQGGSCGVGQMASGRAATLLTLPCGPGLLAGDQVCIALPENRLTFSALLGYLFPVFVMLLGAGLGNLLQESDAATALGAIAGFLLALILARIAISWLPGLLPAPQLIPLSLTNPLSQQEFHHER